MSSGAAGGVPPPGAGERAGDAGVYGSAHAGATGGTLAAGAGRATSASWQWEPARARPGGGGGCAGSHRASGVATAPATMLAGREEMLAELHARMSERAMARRRRSSPSMAWRGQVRPVSRRNMHTGIRSPLEYAWLFPAEEPTVLAAEFGRLAAQLGVSRPASSA